jgi:hypothetical protein
MIFEHRQTSRNDFRSLKKNHNQPAFFLQSRHGKMTANGPGFGLLSGGCMEKNAFSLQRIRENARLGIFWGSLGSERLPREP